MLQNITKTNIEKAIITKINEERVPLEIRSKHIDSLKNPNKVLLKNKQDVYMPDIEAVFGDETHLYEIVLKKDENPDKWRLLSLYARQNNGNLYLVVPESIKDSISNEIKEKNINAGILYFQA